MTTLTYRLGETNDYAFNDPNENLITVTPVAEIRNRCGDVIMTPTVQVDGTSPADFTVLLPVDAGRDRTLDRTRDPELVILMENGLTRRTYVTFDLQVEV